MKKIEPHHLSGKTVVLKSKSDELNGKLFKIEDWQTNVMGSSWVFSTNNPVCISYIIRTRTDRSLIDTKVLYGKIGGLACLVHEEELGEVVEEEMI